jgi:hypothetical protein
MSLRSFAALALFLLATPLAAFNRGEVYFEHSATLPGDSRPAYEAWMFAPGLSFAFAAGASPLIYKAVPMFGPGHFLIQVPNEIVFHDEGTISVWDGVNHIFTEPGLGYTELFHEDAALGEIAPMRNGDFLVTAGLQLIEFNVRGRVREIAFPNVVSPEHIDLLGDQCTLLYDAGNRVARMNICTGAALSDFAVLAAGETAGSIRALPNGDVLVANGNAILRFTADGGLLTSLPFPGVTHIALTPDGGEFYAAGVSGEKASLRMYPAGREIALGNPEMQSAYVPVEGNDLVVVGEWRAATSPKARQRAVR